MTVKELSELTELNVLSLPCPERKIDGVYIGDLLSWVMGRATADNAWITIMSNLNVIAVASLSDVSCVILAEDVRLEDEVLTLAKDKEINVFSTALSAYELAVKLNGIL